MRILFRRAGVLDKLGSIDSVNKLLNIRSMLMESLDYRLMIASCFNSSQLIPLAAMNNLERHIAKSFSSRQVIQEVNVKKQINIGNATFVGDNNRIDHNTITQNSMSKIDVDKEAMILLSEELPRLRKAMRENAQTVDHDKSLAVVAQAEEEICSGNFNEAIKYLKSAGKWTFDVATKIGVSVAAKIIGEAIK